MLSAELLDVDILGAVNAAVYAILAAGLIRARQLKYRPSDASQAFLLLESRLIEKLPDLPEGFTWREAMGRIRELGLDVDWGEVEVALKQYEDWRYGGRNKPKSPSPEVVKLAKSLEKVKSRRP